MRSLTLPRTNPKLEPGRVDHHLLSWSPDGSGLLLTQNGPYETALVVLDIDTGRLRTLARFLHYIDSPIANWSPDGRFVAVTSTGIQDAMDRFDIIDASTARPVIHRSAESGTWRRRSLARSGRRTAGVCSEPSSAARRGRPRLRPGSSASTSPVAARRSSVRAPPGWCPVSRSPQASCTRRRRPTDTVFCTCTTSPPGTVLRSCRLGRESRLSSRFRVSHNSGYAGSAAGRMRFRGNGVSNQGPPALVLLDEVSSEGARQAAESVQCCRSVRSPAGLRRPVRAFRRQRAWRGLGRHRRGLPGRRGSPRRRPPDRAPRAHRPRRPRARLRPVLRARRGDRAGRARRGRRLRRGRRQRRRRRRRARRRRARGGRGGRAAGPAKELSDELELLEAIRAVATVVPAGSASRTRCSSWPWSRPTRSRASSASSTSPTAAGSASTSAAGRSRCPRERARGRAGGGPRARRVPALRPGRRTRGRCRERSRTSAGSGRTTCSS